MRQPLQGTELGENKSDVGGGRSVGPWAARHLPSPAVVSGLPANMVVGGSGPYPGIAVHRIGYSSHTHHTGDQTGQRGGVAGSVESDAPSWYNLFACRGRRADGRLTGGGYAMGAAADPPPLRRGRSRVATRVPTAAGPRLLRQAPRVR